jgi:hypothetical protein
VGEIGRLVLEMELAMEDLKAPVTELVKEDLTEQNWAARSALHSVQGSVLHRGRSSVPHWELWWGTASW